MLRTIRFFLSSRKSWTIPYVIFSAIFVILPLLLIVVYAFMDDAGHFTFGNFTKFFAQNFERFGIKKLISTSYAPDSKKYKINYQMYVNNSDIPGGSTIGSMASALLTMRTLDVGIPILAMHSARETMGKDDQKSLEKLVRVFFEGFY